MTLPSGLISATSMDHSLLEKWTSSLTGSRASHIQSQDTDRESPMSGISGLKRGELLMRYDRPFACWRTYQASMFDLTMDGQHMGALYSESFPNSGMIVSGQLYQLPTQARPISGNGGGLWPTPKVQDSKHSGVSPAQESRHGPDLSTEVITRQQWPTPTTADGGKVSSPYGQIGLANHPDIIGPPTRPKLESKSTKGDGINVARPEGSHNPALNPDWVEWLMGVPIGWSSPEPLPEGAWEEWITDITSGTWWDTERDIPRVTTERTNRNKRLKALGNGIVPRCIPVFLGVVNGTGK